MASQPIGAASRCSSPSLVPYVAYIKSWRHAPAIGKGGKLPSGSETDHSNEISGPANEDIAHSKPFGQMVCDRGMLDVVYATAAKGTSKTADAVQGVFDNKGFSIGLLPSRQLRDILHGRFEPSQANRPGEADKIRIQGASKSLIAQESTDDDLIDKFRFWKVHPLTDKEEADLRDQANVDGRSGYSHSRQERHHHVFRGILREHIATGGKDDGMNIGISTHGTALRKMNESLNKRFKGTRLLPSFFDKGISPREKAAMPAISKAESCALRVLNPMDQFLSCSTAI